jgi:hypothetical protein
MRRLPLWAGSIFALDGGIRLNMYSWMMETWLGQKDPNMYGQVCKTLLVGAVCDSLYPSGKDYSNERVVEFHTLNKPEQDMYDRTKVPRMPWSVCSPSNSSVA